MTNKKILILIVLLSGCLAKKQAIDDDIRTLLALKHRRDILDTAFYVYYTQKATQILKESSTEEEYNYKMKSLNTFQEKVVSIISDVDNNIVKALEHIKLNRDLAQITIHHIGTQLDTLTYMLKARKVLVNDREPG